jgi:hypothetical protein
VIEVEPVQLRADDVPVHLLRNRPAGEIDRGEALAELGDLPGLRRHGGGGVVRDAADELGLLKGAELLEEGNEVVVFATRRRRWCGTRPGHDSRQEAHGHQHRHIA